jgi:Na+-transporting NADH:ubiquinone oxidoreductase subunit NqrC
MSTEIILTRKIRREELGKAKYKTNHLLHLILSFVTGGLWCVIWLLFALRNENQTLAMLLLIST